MGMTVRRVLIGLAVLFVCCALAAIAWLGETIHPTGQSNYDTQYGHMAPIKHDWQLNLPQYGLHKHQ